jgi:hypothetical protein
MATPAEGDEIIIVVFPWLFALGVFLMVDVE